MPGGRIEYRGYPLKILIRTAWDIPSEEEIVNAPKWLDSARFDVIAKASTITRNSSATEAADIHLMLRALLADRFKLVTHYEDRPVTTYTLVAAKPKLQKADPSNRTGCKEGPGPDGKDPRIANPQLNRLVTCLNMSMAQFADQLQNMASGYVHSPVLDKTGLEGSWDFMLSFSGAGIIQGGGGRGGDRGGDAPQPGNQANASDPSGGISLMDAINKELGVKLEEVKRPVRVLVVDHVNRTPSDN